MLSPGSENGEDPLLREAGGKQLLKDGMTFAIFRDSSYAWLDGHCTYRSGTWMTEGQGKTIQLSAAIQFDLEALDPAGRPRMVWIDTARGYRLGFVRTKAPLADDRQDPFHPTNNTWRQRSDSASDSATLRLKLANYFRHLSCILKASIDRKEEVVSFACSQGLVRIYNGGIGIVPYDQLPESWLAVFGSPADAKRAHDLFRDYLARSSYRGASKGDWVADDYDILLSIYADFVAQAKS